MVDTVQGFLANLVLDGNDITNRVTATPLARSKDLLSKNVMDGIGDAFNIPGISSGSLNVSGYISQAELNNLEVSWAKDVPVSFVLTVAEGLGTDSSWAGDVTLGTFDVEPVGDGMWEFTLSGDTDGPILFTPSVP